MSNIQKTILSTLTKKMYTKYISKGVSISLMKYNPKSKLFKAYKNTSYCAETLVSNDTGKLTTTYCKNRWCQTCNRIKIAILIKGYYSQIEEFENPCFVTLTLPTCKGNELLERIKLMENAWRFLCNKTKRVPFKRLYNDFKGLRKAEITIRPNGFYHYHFHVLLDGLEQGEWLISQWLKKFSQASRKSQHIREVDDFGKMEIFKYAIKCEVKTSNSNAKRYDLVYNSLRGKRTFSAFGGIKKVDVEQAEDDLKSNIQTDMINHVFKWMKDDWYNKETGEGLVKLPIPEKVKNMVNYPD